MKIAVDVRSLGIAKFAGISSYIRQFLRIASQNNEHEIFALSDSEIIVPANVHLIVRKASNTIFWDQFILPNILKKYKADVFLNPLIKAPLYLPCPMAWIINDLNHIASLPEYSGFNSKLRKIYFGFLVKQAFKKKPYIGAISIYTATLVAKIFNYSKEDISIINLSPEFIENSEKDENKLKIKYNLPIRFILYLGNFRKHKNVITLIQAYSTLTKELQSQVKLVLAGEKEFEYDYLRSISEKLGISSSVIFSGPIQEQDKQLLYKLADIFVLPSVSEGFGLPLLEAMSQGTPVIAADVSALPEICHYDDDLMFPKRDSSVLAAKLSNLLSDTLKRTALQNKVLSIAKNYTPEKTVEQIIQLCNRASSNL